MSAATNDTDPGHLSRSFGAQLRRHREQAGASQRGQAAELGVANNTLRELEQGLANPTLRRVEEVAAAVGLRVTITLSKARR